MLLYHIPIVGGSNRKDFLLVFVLYCLVSLPFRTKAVHYPTKKKEGNFFPHVLQKVGFVVSVFFWSQVKSITETEPASIAKLDYFVLEKGAFVRYLRNISPVNLINMTWFFFLM